MTFLAHETLHMSSLDPTNGMLCLGRRVPSPARDSWQAPGARCARSPRLLPCSRIRGDGRGPQTLVIGGLGFIPAGAFLHWWKNEVARATSKMAKYIEVLHGSVKEGGGVKCIKRGEIPYCTFTYTYCFVDAKSKAKRLRYTGFHPSV